MQKIPVVLWIVTKEPTLQKSAHYIVTRYKEDMRKERSYSLFRVKDLKTDLKAIMNEGNKDTSGRFFINCVGFDKEEKSLLPEVTKDTYFIVHGNGGIISLFEHI